MISRSYAEVTRGQCNTNPSNRSTKSGHRLSYVHRRDECIQISLDDVEEERMYWANSLIGYVLGLEVPFTVMEGFVRRFWNYVVKPEIHLYQKEFFHVSFC